MSWTKSEIKKCLLVCQIDCEHCGSTNWVSWKMALDAEEEAILDANDEAEGPEGITCWNCKGVSIFVDGEYDDEEGIKIVNGRPDGDFLRILPL